MNKTFYTNRILILLFILVVTSSMNCEEPNAPKILPPVSESGSGRLGCKLDGKVWQPDGKSVFSILYYNTYSPYSKEKGRFNIRAGRHAGFNLSGIKIHTHMYFNYLNIIDTGYYPTKLTTLYTRHHKDGYSYNRLAGYYSDSNSYGWIHIHRLDTINKIIAGTFELDAIRRPDSTTTHFNDTIKITEGRFDLKYE